MYTSREAITEKYLLMALKELSKHRGAIKKGRSIDQMWHDEIIHYENVGKYMEDRPILNLKKKGD